MQTGAEFVKHDCAHQQMSDFLGAIGDVQRLGFRALLGWHYLVLFGPLFVTGGSGDDISQTVILRQLVLYVTLAVAFALLFAVGRLSAKANRAISSPVIVIVACVCGAVSTLLVGPAFAGGGTACVVATVVLGTSEAVLMCAWLCLFGAASPQSHHSLGVDVVTGSLIALLVEALVAPADYVVAACLPLLSATLFTMFKRTRELSPSSGEGAAVQDDASTHGKDDDLAAHAPEMQENRASAYIYLFKRTIPAALFALALGLLQGALFADGIGFLVAFNPLTLLGVVAAGVVIFFTTERFCTHTDADSMYHASLLFFVMGVVFLILIWTLGIEQDTMAMEWSLIVSEFAVLAGFNLFDYGNMMLCLGVSWISGGKMEHLVVMGRFIVYAFTSIGYLCGIALVPEMVADNTSVLMVTYCIVLFLLMLTLLISSSANQDHMLLACVRADGVTDEELVQRSLDLSCMSCGSADRCSIRSAVQSSIAATARVTTKEAQLDEKLAQMASEEQGKVSVYAREKDSAAYEDELLPHEDMEIGEMKRKRSPWRDACDEVARRYRLSKREKQIFLLVAKGRNAEYVSQELVISIHTAKTHIANIYQKLDVHSSQEVLDLIDTFRKESEREDAERRNAC